MLEKASNVAEKETIYLCKRSAAVSKETNETDPAPAVHGSSTRRSYSSEAMPLLPAERTNMICDRHKMECLLSQPCGPAPNPNTSTAQLPQFTLLKHRKTQKSPQKKSIFQTPSHPSLLRQGNHNLSEYYEKNRKTCLQ